jgi:four helix bundle protein
MPCGARGDLYHIEAQLYRMGKAHISSLRKQTYRKKVSMCMADNKNQLREESIDFALAVSDMCDEIKGCSVYVNQLLRCSSSIGANIHEARYAQSRADFISKLEIALKEASEKDYWLELLFRKQKLTNEQYLFLKSKCGAIRRKLIASITTAKANSGKYI